MSASGLMRISLLAAVAVAAVQSASAQHVMLDAPGIMGQKKAPAPPPPLRSQPTVWPRLDPGAVLCRTSDDLDRYAANMTARASGGDTQAADCQIIAQPTGSDCQPPGAWAHRSQAEHIRQHDWLDGCLAARQGACDPMTHIVVGAGQAGGWAAIAMRQAGYEGRILLIGDEPWRPYERPPLSKAVLTDEPEPPIAFFHAAERYEDQRIEPVLGVTVTELDPAGHRVRLSDGRSLDYDRLVLTVGGRARHLPIPGGDRALYLRTIEDARLIRDRLATAQSVICIGAGVIGLEIASSACRRGAEVTVLEALPRAMGRSVSPEGAHFVETLHRDAGVVLIWGDRRCDRGCPSSGCT